MKKYIPNHMSGLVLTLCAIMMTLTTSCDSDDTFETPTSDSRQEELVFSEAEKARIIEELHNKMVMQALCDVDTNTCPATYTPRLGKVLDNATPTIRYTVANTKEEAERHYMNIIGSLIGNSDSATPGHDVTVGDIHLTYVEGAQAGETARIIIDCPRLRNVLTAIVFLTRAAWPENAQATTPFTLLSVWKHLPSHRLYLCVREPCGCDGIMITLADYNQGKSFGGAFQSDIRLYDKAASWEAYDCLADNMECRGTSFETMLKELSKKYSNDPTYYLLNKLWTSNDEILFDCHWGVTTVFGKVVALSLQRAKFKNKKYSKVNETYYLKIDPPQAKPSNSINFSLNYDRKDTEWEKVYQPGGAGRKNRGD